MTVVVEQTPSFRPAPDEPTSEEDRRKLLAELDAIAALPIEGSLEPFSGRDHDKVLYGEIS